MNEKKLPNVETVKSYLIQLQQNICSALEKEDGGKKFITDTWQRDDIDKNDKRGRASHC